MTNRGTTSICAVVAVAVGLSPALAQARHPTPDDSGGALVPRAPEVADPWAGTMPSDGTAPTRSVVEGAPVNVAVNVNPPPPAPPLGAAVMRAPCSKAAAALSAAERIAQAEARLAEAVARFDAADYLGALDAIDRAACYRADAQHDYMRAIIHVTLGDCAQARRYERRFLTTDPPRVDAVALRKELAGCRAPTLPGPVPPASGEPRAPHDGRVPWRDPWAAALLGTGLVGVVAGGAAIGWSNRSAPQPTSYADHVADRDERARAKTAGAVTLGVGVSLVVGATIRYLVLRDRAKRQALAAR